VEGKQRRKERERGREKGRRKMKKKGKKSTIIIFGPSLTPHKVII
jgi:hypothetical protein